MKYFLIVTILLCWTGLASAQTKQGWPGTYNLTITSGTAVQVIPPKTVVDWTIFAENNNIRCVPLRVGQTIANNGAPPSSTNGWLVVGAGAPLSSYPLTDPNAEIDCIAVGTTANVSVWIDTHE